MSGLLNWLGDILEPIMNLCYSVSGIYAVAIFLFTFISKIILIPLTVFLQFNSIKMIKMQPEINFAKVDFGNDKERMGEEQLNLYKKYNYHPMLGVIPLFVQLLLLMGVINVIYRQISSELLFNLWDLSWLPKDNGGAYIFVPIIAAASSALLCIIQNKENVLQAEQSKASQAFTMILSVGLALYLGYFVPVAVAFYWVCSNVLSIIQLYIVNAIIPPKKYIDYEKLELSRAALMKKKQRDASINKKFFEKDPYRPKEAADYKRFYSQYNKQIVFYAEKNGFYKYYKATIEYILANSDIVIHYVTSDPLDKVFDLTSDRFKTYYIGTKRLISFMMKMDCNVIVMSTPDLDKSYLKKSMIRKDIEYIYIPHGVSSPNLTVHTNCVEHYDTVFCHGPECLEELRAIEKLYGSKEKQLIPWGSSVIDDMIEAWEKKSETHVNEVPTMLIAPSWQEDNIIDYCVEPMLDALLKTGYRIILRPHPQYVRYGMPRLEELKEKYKDYELFELQTDFSSNETVYNADVLVTDWSGIGLEYAYSTLKPALFIDTPMKVMNREWERLDIEPINITARNQIGKSVDPFDIKAIEETAVYLMEHREKYREDIRVFREKHLCCIGNCGQVAGDYILSANKRVDDNKAEYLKYLSNE